jgi:hypothetical protein
MAYPIAQTTQAQVEAFRAAAEAKIQAEFRKVHPNTTSDDLPYLDLMDGPRYVRVVRENRRVRDGRTDTISRSAFAFVDKQTGEILKPAGWNAPARHARGSVHTSTHGVEFINYFGPLADF